MQVSDPLVSSLLFDRHSIHMLERHGCESLFVDADIYDQPHRKPGASQRIGGREVSHGAARPKGTGAGKTNRVGQDRVPGIAHARGDTKVLR